MVDYNSEKPDNWPDEEPQEVPNDNFTGTAFASNNTLAADKSRTGTVIVQPILKNFKYGCIPYSLDSDTFNPTFSVTVKAKDANAAEAAGQLVAANGVGVDLPPNTSLDHFVRSTIIGSDLWIGASQVGDFAEYQLMVNGAVVADLVTQTNVAEIAEGSGWETQWSAVPVSMIQQTGNVIEITQRLVGQNQSYTGTVNFDI